MSNIPEYLRNFSATVDGGGFVGKVEEVELPKVALKTEEMRNGGMDAPIDMDMGTEKIDTMLMFNSFKPELWAAFGLSVGNSKPIILRGSIDDDGEQIPVVVTMRGRWKEIDMGSWKAGEKGGNKFTANLKYYRLEIAGREVVEIDVENFVRKINGVDQLSQVRANIGL